MYAQFKYINVIRYLTASIDNTSINRTLNKSDLQHYWPQITFQSLLPVSYLIE